jgi:phenylalanyl-tRNA synthetase beta chain
MIVSWNWLREYVKAGCSAAEAADRLTHSGLNLETIEPAGDDFAIDLEVTSNRPDCLGHIGVARELAVLEGRPLQLPEITLTESPEPTSAATSVTNDCPDLCPQYTARVIRGVKVGASPAWLQARLQAIGINPINNVVDVTNYVLMECGQPLHAFDLAKLAGRRIVVRRGRPGEALDGIDHVQYRVTPEMCVIADAEKPVAIGGVMGGAGTEITNATTDVLIETANFLPLSIRATARSIRRADEGDRRKGLFSDSSYRFERGIDVQQLHWASRRCCQLILATAGGTLLSGSVVAGAIPAWKPSAVPLRLAQIERLLGISIPREEVVRILTALGLQLSTSAGAERLEFFPPAWRRDLGRECDLIEEVARIHGYDRIPENRAIPVIAGTKSARERVQERVRAALAAAGFDEALTLSFTPSTLIPVCDPCPEIPATEVDPAAGEYGNRLRKSLAPSLVQSRRDNERRGNTNVRLYEIARVFRAPQPADPTTQPVVVGFVTGQSFSELKGVLDSLVSACGIEEPVVATPANVAGLIRGRSATLTLGCQPWGYLGELDRDGPAVTLKVRDPLHVAEIDLQRLIDFARLVPHAKPLPAHPAVARDLNFVLDEAVSWQKLETVVRRAAQPLLRRVAFVDQYRGKQLPAGKKSYVLKLEYQSLERTLSGDEVDAAQQAVIGACRAELGAELR